MKGLDGFKAAEQIWEYRQETRIIAQAAYAMSSDREEIIRHGFTDYITKPIQKQKLIDLLV